MMCFVIFPSITMQIAGWYPGNATTAYFQILSLYHSSHHPMVQPQRVAYITGQGPHKSTIALPLLFLAKLLPNLKAGIQHTAVCQIRILSEGTHNTF